MNSGELDHGFKLAEFTQIFIRPLNDKNKEFFYENFNFEKYFLFKVRKKA